MKSVQDLSECNIETKEYLGDYTRNLYDGFSFDVIGKSVLQSAYSANMPEQMYRTPNRQSAGSVTGSGTIHLQTRNDSFTDTPGFVARHATIRN